MNLNWKRLIEGVFLSFIPLFSFVFFVYGSQVYLSSENNSKEMFLGSVSDAVLTEDYNIGQNAEVPLVTNNEPGNAESDNKDLASTEINSKAAISVESDLKDNETVIFQKNENLKLPIASLTKLMTAVISFENYDLSQDITVNKEADEQLPMQTDFKLGDTFPIEKFLHVMLIESSNKAAYALAEHMGQEKFITLMNLKAKKIGLKNTFFADPTGLSAQNVSTVNDLMTLAKYILKNYPEIAQITTIKNYELDNLGKITNTNQLLTDVPEIIFSKTGFTNYANGCLLIAINNLENNNYLINIILGADDRFLEMKKLINWKNISDNNK